MRLEAKSALITGGAQGIGAAIAVAFADEGARVMIADKDPETAETTAAAIRNYGGRADIVAADLAEPADCERAVEACTRGVRQP